MARGSNIYLYLAIASIIITWLFVGLFRDDEFYEPSLFLKHQPTFKTIFYSPMGMADLHYEDLPNKERAEEIAFQEYVVKQNIQMKNGVELFFVPLILIQTTLTLLSFGGGGSGRKLVYKKWHLIAHFIVCFIALIIGYFLIQSFDKLVFNLLIGISLLGLNIGFLLKITKSRSIS